MKAHKDSNKRSLIAIVLACSVSAVFGQGTINFANSGSTFQGGTFDEPIYQADGITPLDNTYEVGLYIGQFGNGLSLVPGSVTPISGNGLFNGGVITFPNSPPNTLLKFTVAAWKASEGNSLEAAIAVNQYANWGVSHFWGTGLGGGGLPPADLSGMGSFNLVGAPVPEPKNFILFGVGGVVLWFAGRGNGFRLGSRIRE